MLRKRATCVVVDAWKVPRSNTARSLRKAAHRVGFEYTPRPGFLYVRSRAISSRTNDNHDTFPADEIEKSYRSFLGKPVFVNHHNANHRRARGVIIAAALHHDRSPDGAPDTWVELLHEIDAQRFPKLAQAIIEGRVNRTSMGVDCEYSTCSACGNRATSPADYCVHMPAKKGMKIRQRGQDGKLHERRIHEICAGLTFFENSFLVEDPADPTAYVLDKPDTRGLKRSAALTATAQDRSGDPDFRDHLGNTCIGCGQRVKWSKHPTKGGWKHYSQISPQGGFHDHAAIPADPDAKGTVHQAQYGGTECLMCHEPVKISLDHLHTSSGGWSHHDGMKRDHPAIPADPWKVYDAIPGIKARQDAAYSAMGDYMHRTFEQMSGRPLPRKPRGDEDQLPPDPFAHGAALRVTAEDKPEPYMLRVMHHLRDAHGVDDEILPFMAARSFKDAHGRLPHGPGASDKEAPEGESANDRLRRYNDTATSMAEALEGLHLAHHKMHGENWREEGGVRPADGAPGTRHVHGPQDELTSYEHRPYRADTYKTGDEPPAPGWPQEEMAVVSPRSRSGEGLPSYMKQVNYNEHRLHPDRPENLPNMSSHCDPHDRSTWTNLDACSQVYRGPEREASEDAMARPHIPVSEHERWRAQHEEDEKNGLLCPECGAQKGMHAMYRPSEAGRIKPEYAEETRQEWREKTRGKTAPFIPQMPHMSALEAEAAGRRFFDQPLYHGTRTRLEPGQHLTVDEAARFANNPDIQADPYVHATTDAEEAYRWGQRADSDQAQRRAEENGTARGEWESRGMNSDDLNPPHVYRVRPTGHVEPDLEYADTEHDSYRSAHPMRVTEHVYPLYCHGEECGGASHWPGHPHYDALKQQDDEDEEEYRERHAMRRQGAPRYETPADHPFFQANKGSKQNLKDGWHDTSHDEREQGRRWYPDAHLVGKAIAHGDAALGAGMLAAYSPRTNWPANMFNAARSIHIGRALGPGDGAIMGMHQRPAARILAGEHHSQVFKGPKISAFAHLIEHGGQHGDTRRVVIDRHALSAWIGRRVTDNDISAAPLDKPRYYQHVEKDFIDAADELSDETGEHISPEHLQAALWLRQVRRNAAEDQAVRGAGGKGRVRNQSRDRERWEDFRREHHPDLPGGGEMHHSAAMIRQAADPPLRVPPSVDTLRPEACPVCGDQDVFKGQRCPVCGYVAPPDLFRDPDTDLARANRQQLEDGKVPSGFPEGPADEEQIGSGMDAEEQLMHPDQIAPNGIPGAVGDPTDPGQGMLGGDGELADPAQLGEDGQELPLLDEQGQPAEQEEGDPDALDDPEEEAREGAQLEGEGEQLQDEGAQLEEQGEEEQEEAAAAAGSAPMTQGSDDGDQALAGGLSSVTGEPGGDEEDEEGGSPGKEQDEDDDESGGKKMTKDARRTVEAAQHVAVAELRRENAVLRTGLRYIAELAGIGPQLDQILRQADLMNPAQPVPDPPQAPPTSTTEQALMTGAPTGSGNGTRRGPGHSMDDPSRPGATPGSMTAVPAQQTTTAITPGVELDTPPGNNMIDVTAPVQGTNPSQDGGVPIEQRRIETDVRIDPDPLKAQGPGIGGVGNDGTAFPWVLNAGQPGQQQGGMQQRQGSLSAEDERGARTMAAIRLGRLRVQAGLARGDELEVGSAIERTASLSLRDIEHEIATLTAVSRTASAGAPRYPTGMAPRQQRTAARSAPSFASQPQSMVPVMASAGGGGYGDDDFDVFLD